MNFAAYQQLNLARHAELSKAEPWATELAECAPAIEAELSRNTQPFTHNAVVRAHQLVSVSGLLAAYKNFCQRSRFGMLLVGLLMAALGFFAVTQTLAAAQNEINVYWLLILLLGLNCVSMLLWLALTLGKSSAQSPIIMLYRKLLAAVTSGRRSTVLFDTWSETHLYGNTGRWFLSKQLHSAWLLYLAGGLVALLITLSGKQYNFVWGTTILPTQTFITVTETLAVGPAALGFEVPAKNAIVASEQGQVRAAMAGHRTAWAGFIVGCILVYAVLPRLLLLLFSVLALSIAKKRYQPDWELPYFFALRSRLLPHSSSLGVVDADHQSTSAENAVLHHKLTSPGSESEVAARQALVSIDELDLPPQAYVAAFEWGETEPPHPPVQNPTKLGAINDVNAQTGTLQAIKQSPMPAVILVELRRAADRGAVRFLRQIAELTSLHLVVVRTGAEPADAARWAGWQSVAERVGLSFDAVHLVKASSHD